MNIRSLISIIGTLVIVTIHSRGALVKEGSDFEAVDRAMTEAGYGKGGLQIGTAAESRIELECWSVDQGVLVVSYSSESRRVVSITFHLSDERPRGIRKNFDFKVASFDTEAGTMVLQTKPPKGAKVRTD